MDFIAFLHQSRTPEFWKRSTRIGFTGKEYPILFFSDFFKQKTDQLSPLYSGVTYLDLQNAVRNESMASLETTFLGMRSLYWLKNISELNSASKKEWLSYISGYQGPHSLIFFVGADDAEFDDTITIPATVDIQLFTQLLIFFAGNAAAERSAQAVQTLYARRTALSVDNACSMIRYIALIGNQYQAFFDNWLDMCIVPETSLFTLSQHFFARAPQKFFATWKSIAPHYGEQFWITFWSEQLWRAYHVVDYLQQSRFVEAKSISYRLPFSLMQGDWRKLTLSELQQAHAFMYTIDLSLKNGGDAGVLDLFYSKFFLKQFQPEKLLKST